MTVWDAARLEADRRAAITVFRRERMTEPLEQYLAAFDDRRMVIGRLLEETEDLARLADRAVEILADPRLREAVRYLAGPPLSEDDLRVIADVPSIAPSRLRADPQAARRLVDTVLAGLDRRRYGWVSEGRGPGPDERAAATLATAALMASQHIQTARRSGGKTAQEDAVRSALIADGFIDVPARRITQLADAPAAGEFCRETMFGSRKADLVLGLWSWFQHERLLRLVRAGGGCVPRRVRCSTWLSATPALRSRLDPCRPRRALRLTTPLMLKPAPGTGARCRSNAR
jgi:hypothetical protein